DVVRAFEHPEVAGPAAPTLRQFRRSLPRWPRGATRACGGAAHLCGHDLHTAIRVGIAQVLARLSHRRTGRIVFVFQPAEETLEGARAMLETDVLKRTAPAQIYALHCGPLPVGTFAVIHGVGQPGLDQFAIVLSGPTAAADGQQLVAMIKCPVDDPLPADGRRVPTALGRFADTGRSAGAVCPHRVFPGRGRRTGDSAR